jgi:hypothetical protein
VADSRFPFLVPIIFTDQLGYLRVFRLFNRSNALLLSTSAVWFFEAQTWPFGGFLLAILRRAALCEIESALTDISAPMQALTLIRVRWCMTFARLPHRFAHCMQACAVAELFHR